MMFKKILTAISGLISNFIFYILGVFLFTTYCLASDNVDKESISMCAMIRANAISDVYEIMSTKTSKDNSYILLTSVSEVNYSWGDDRLAIDGHAYILNDTLLKLGSLVIFSMKNGKPTDEVIYLRKSNRGVGGVFYRGIAKDGLPEVNAMYINGLGRVSHFNVSASPECLSHFPKSVLSRVSTE
ncbi:hypothetical protein [Scandinavium sp.]|uniref:hypothetical protein n=1 Tax=Scandinavium sp. TaxID=2830653 RepID=UPI002897153D|nr:hypothetical protein [Scandinavium sp.]